MEKQTETAYLRATKRQQRLKVAKVFVVFITLAILFATVYAIWHITQMLLFLRRNPDMFSNEAVWVVIGGYGIISVEVWFLWSARKRLPPMLKHWADKKQNK